MRQEIGGRGGGQCGQGRDIIIWDENGNRSLSLRCKDQNEFVLNN